MGEGGALLIRDPGYIDAAEIIREKGTNRSQYYRGQVDKYTWMNYGSSYLPSDMNAAYLWAQLELAEEINAKRISVWNYYQEALRDLVDRGLIEVPYVPKECTHNAHMFYVKTKDLQERTDFIAFMDQKGIMTPFHYVPLHTAPAGRKYARFHGEDRYTTSESDRLVRLPLFYAITEEQMEYVVRMTKEFYRV